MEQLVAPTAGMAAGAYLCTSCRYPLGKSEPLFFQFMNEVYIKFPHVKPGNVFPV